MREIKFRAWDKEVSEMIYAGERNGMEEHYFSFENKVFKLMCAVDDDYPRPVDAVIMQFAGLKDKNGKDIYEGDILESNASIKIVYFDNGTFGIKDKNHIPKNPYPLFNMNMEYWEVIGNIYENP